MGEDQEFSFNGLNEIDHLNTQDSTNIEDYLFEPDLNKIMDISDYDKNTSWIPRIDRFGDFIGDDILESRQKITKAKYDGFYEDLTDDSEVFILNDNQLNFTYSEYSILLKNIENPILLLTFNGDLFSYGGVVEYYSEKWAISNLENGSFTPRECFIIQCHEIIRLLHLGEDLGRNIQNFAIYCIMHLKFTIENYYDYSAAVVYYFLKNDRINSLFPEEKIDLIEYPFLFAIQKRKLDKLLVILDETYTSLEFKEFQNGCLRIEEITIKNVEFSHGSDVNFPYKVVSNSLLDLYLEPYNKYNDPFYQIQLIAELLVKHTYKISDSVNEVYTKFLKDLIISNPNLLQLFKRLRMIFLSGSVFLHKNLSWSPSLLFNRIAVDHILKNQYFQSINNLYISHQYLDTKRDLIQLQFTYSFILKSLKLYSFESKILQSIYSMLICPDLTVNTYQFLDFLDYSFVIHHYLPSKHIYQKEFYDLYIQILRYLSYFGKNYRLPPLTSEMEERGVNLLNDFVKPLTFNELSWIVRSKSSDVFYLMLNQELYEERIDIERVIILNEYILLITNNLEIYSMVYQISYDYSFERIVCYLNLFILYYYLEEIECYKELRKQFQVEFTTKLENELFVKLNYAISSEENLELYLLNEPAFNFLEDRSLLYFVKLKKLVEEYFITRDSNNMVLELSRISQILENKVNFRPMLEILKIIYQIKLNIQQDKDAKLVKDKIDKIIIKHKLDPKESDLEPIKDSILQQVISISNIQTFLLPIK